MGESRGAYRVIVGKREGRIHLKDRGIDGAIILNWILKNWNEVGVAWTGSILWALVNDVMNPRVS
jgi:uncharacterized membrane protein YeaQ/YmgE (transglycosylase-associated protein family)